MYLKFIGLNGSLGLVKDKTYFVTSEINEHYIILRIHGVHGKTVMCPYEALEKVLERSIITGKKLALEKS